MKKSEIRSVIGESILADGMSPIIDLEKSHGSWLVDKVSGKEYLDLFSMFASLSVGYNHPYVLEQSERLRIAAINKPTNSDIYSPEMAKFVETFSRLAQPDYLPYSFFIEGGSLAVENTLKAAFDWKVKLNLSKGKKEKGNKIITLYNERTFTIHAYNLQIKKEVQTIKFLQKGIFKIDKNNIFSNEKRGDIIFEINLC